VSLGLTPGKILLLYCGRLTEAKGIRDMLAAVKFLDATSESSQVELLVVGNGPLFQEAQAEVAALKKIRGCVVKAVPHDRIGSVMSCADILILPSRTTPSWKEQFGRVIVEGMACGLTVVGSNSGAIGRVIERTGGGSVFPEGDAESLYSRLLELIREPDCLARLRLHGEKYVHRELTHDAMATKLAVALRKCLPSEGK
jgi:glycosyltransferase involved in cell wall biosynthesis